MENRSSVFLFRVLLSSLFQFQLTFLIVLLYSYYNNPGGFFFKTPALSINWRGAIIPPIEEGIKTILILQMLKSLQLFNIKKLLQLAVSQLNIPKSGGSGQADWLTPSSSATLALHGQEIQECRRTAGSRRILPHEQSTQFTTRGLLSAASLKYMQPIF